MQGCGAAPRGDRSIEAVKTTASTRSIKHTAGNSNCKKNNNKKERTLTCFNRDAALVPDVGRHVERSPPLDSTEATALRRRPPRLQKPGRTCGGAARGRRMKVPPPRQPPRGLSQWRPCKATSPTCVHPPRSAHQRCGGSSHILVFGKEA